MQFDEVIAGLESILEEDLKVHTAVLVSRHDHACYWAIELLKAQRHELKQALAHGKSLATPQPGQIWRHHNGNIYEVIMLANAHSITQQYPVHVIYRGANGHIWTKTLSNFQTKMTYIPFITADMLADFQTQTASEVQNGGK